LWCTISMTKKLNIVKNSELYIAIAFLIITTLSFATVVHWLFRQTLLHQQLQSALSMLFFVAVVLLKEKHHCFKLKFTVTPLALYYIGIASVILYFGHCFFSNKFIFSAFATFVSCGFAFASWIIVIFGECYHKHALQVLGLFVLYSVIVVCLPILDWPLRTIAGTHAAWLLNTIGYNCKLQIETNQNITNLIISMNQYKFNVAAQCNGYGMLGSISLVAMLLLYFEKNPILTKIFYWFCSLCLAILLNILRIVIICILAKKVGKHYHLMHETVGYTMLILALLIVWLKLHLPKYKAKNGEMCDDSIC